MNIGYKRVSTKEQCTARQLADIELDRIYEDYISGATKNRPELNRCLDALREGDTLHVHAIDRLSRSLRDLLDIVDVVLKAKANLIIYSPYMKISTHEQDYMHTFQLHLWGMIAQMERSMSRVRREEGIANARKNGTKSGKPFGQQPLDPSLKPKVIALFHSGTPVTEISKSLGISRTSVYNLLKGQSKTKHY